METELLGIQPTSDPERFLAAHNALIDDMDKDVNERLPVVKREVIDRTVAYLEPTDAAARDSLAERLETRLAATDRILLSDTLAAYDDLTGNFVNDGRGIELYTGSLIRELKNSSGEDAYRSVVDHVIIAHEVIHGMLAAGFLEHTIEGRKVIRNGLFVLQVENPESEDIELHPHAIWLAEATIESFRQTLFETGQVRYELGVMVLHMLDKLSPGLRDRAVLAAIDGAGPAPLFGEVEGMLGPTAIEEIQVLIENTTAFEHLDAFRDNVATMLSRELQEEGRAILAQEQEKIFSKRSAA